MGRRRPMREREVVAVHGRQSSYLVHDWRCHEEVAVRPDRIDCPHLSVSREHRPGSVKLAHAKDQADNLVPAHVHADLRNDRGHIDASSLQLLSLLRLDLGHLRDRRVASPARRLLERPGLVRDDDTDHDRAPSRAHAALDEAHAAYVATGDPEGVARVEATRGLVLIDEERYADAASLLAASIERLRAAGDGRNVAVALNNWALAQLMLGHPEAAQATFQEARAAQQTQLDRRAVAIASLNIALAAQDCGLHAEAIAEFSSALDDLDALGARQHVASAAYAIAGLAAELNDNEDATVLASAALREWARLGAAPSLPARKRIDPGIQRARLHLGDASARAAEMRGASMAVGQLVPRARSVLAQLAAAVADRGH